MSRRFVFPTAVISAFTAVLLSSGAAHADPIRGHGHQYHHGGGYHHGYHHPHSNFVLNISSGPAFYPRPFYHHPRPFYYPPRVIHETIVYGSPTSYYPRDRFEEADDEDGRYCREFQKEIVVGGRIRNGYGRACMQPDGSWEVVS